MALIRRGQLACGLLCMLAVASLWSQVEGFGQPYAIRAKKGAFSQYEVQGEYACVPTRYNVPPKKVMDSLEQYAKGANDAKKDFTKENQTPLPNFFQWASRSKSACIFLGENQCPSPKSTVKGITAKVFPAQNFVGRKVSSDGTGSDLRQKRANLIGELNKKKVFFFKSTGFRDRGQPINTFIIKESDGKYVIGFGTKPAAIRMPLAPPNSKWAKDFVKPKVTEDGAVVQSVYPKALYICNNNNKINIKQTRYLCGGNSAKKDFTSGGQTYQPVRKELGNKPRTCIFIKSGDSVAVKDVPASGGKNMKPLVLQQKNVYSKVVQSRGNEDTVRKAAKKMMGYLDKKKLKYKKQPITVTEYAPGKIIVSLDAVVSAKKVAKAKKPKKVNLPKPALTQTSIPSSVPAWKTPSGKPGDDPAEKKPLNKKPLNKKPLKKKPLNKKLVNKKPLTKKPLKKKPLNKKHLK